LFRLVRACAACAAALGSVATVHTAVARAASSQPTVRAMTIDGKTLEGFWQGIKPGGVLQFKSAAGEDISIAADQAMSVRFADAPATQPVTDRGFLFYLSDGSRFAGRLIGGDSKQLAISARGS